MSSAVTGKGVPVKVPNRSIRLSVLRLVRMAVAFVVVAGSLGLATVTATAQDGGSSCPSDGAEAYSDVPESSYAYDDSRCLRELGISDAGDTYRPGADMTRSEMAAFMANAYKALTGEEAPIEDHMFTDIADDPNADDIARISPNGLDITKGTTPTTYSPNDPVIRGHMALFLTRLYEKVAGSAAPTGATEFTDIAERSDEQQAAIGQIFALGVTTGTTDTTYSPSNNVTREQMASFVARMYRALDALPDPAEAPGAPTGVEVAVSGDAGDALDVSWTAPEDSGTSDVTGYVVQWKSGDDDYSDDNQSSVDDTSSNFDGLTQGTAYTFRVAAVSDDGQSDWSDEASGSPATVPGAVSDFTATAGNESLELAWAAPADDGGSAVTGYVVQWAAGRGARQQVEIDDGDATSYTIRELRNDLSYSVWIQAVNAAGVGTITTPGDGTAPGSGGGAGLVSPEPVAAGAPANLTAGTRVDPTTRALVPTSLDLSWSEPANSGGANLMDFDVQIRCGTTVAWAALDVEDYEPTTRVYQRIIEDRKAGEACEVRVRVNSWVNLFDHDSDPDTPSIPETLDPDSANVDRIRMYDVGDKRLAGPWATVSATTAGPPGVPTNVEVTNAHQSLQVTWAAPVTTQTALEGEPDNGGSPITGYEITWDGGGTATVGADARSYTITGLDNRYNYTVAVKAVNAAGKSGAGSDTAGEPAATSALLTVKPEAVNSAPSNVAAVPPPVVTGVPHVGTTLKVTWNAPGSNGTTPARSYVVERRTSMVPAVPGVSGTSPAGPWETTGVDANIDVVNRKVDIIGLDPGTAYDVRVQAVNIPDPRNAPNMEVNGPWATGSGTPATQPDPVVLNTGDDLEPGFSSVTVRWAAPESGGSDITHYLVRYALSSAGSQFSSDIRVNAPATRTTIRGLRTDSGYVVQVQAVNAIGKGTSSAETGFSTSGVASAPASVVAVSIATRAPADPTSNNTLFVRWSRVTQTNGGGAITGYTIQYRQVTPTGAYIDGEGWSGAVAENVVIPDDKKTEAVIVLTRADAEGGHYLVRVRANANNAGSSGYAAVVKSEGVPLVGEQDGQHPLSPTVSINTEVSKTTLNVEWNSISPADVRSTITGYKVRWFPSEAGEGGSIGSADVSGKETGKYAITGLTPGTYTVVVSVVNHVGGSAETTAMSGENSDQPTIAVPR